MYILPYLITAMGAIMICYQDIKSRLIHLSSFVVFGAGLIMSVYAHERFWDNFLLNVGFLFLLMCSLKLYVMFRNGYKERLLDRYIGKGDLLILLLFCVSYNLYNYLCVILLGCMLAIGFFLSKRLLSGIVIVRIPFAAFLSIVHMIVISYCLRNSIDPIDSLFYNLPILNL